jgi:NADH:ubiquinone oxidoreductase subunit 4 (subunit M)
MASGLMFSYISERALGNTAQMLFQQRYSWYSALNIEYFIGVDGISVAMIMLTALLLCSRYFNFMERSKSHKRILFPFTPFKCWCIWIFHIT